MIHEIAHGAMAYQLGDQTAKYAGRLTLNPLKHIDPFGTIILPGILIILRSLGSPIVPVGFAKPVPVLAYSKETVSKICYIDKFTEKIIEKFYNIRNAINNINKRRH